MASTPRSPTGDRVRSGSQPQGHDRPPSAGVASHGRRLPVLAAAHSSARGSSLRNTVAEASGLSVRSVRNLESGAVSAPSASFLQRIAEALRLDDAAYRQLTDLALCGHHAHDPTRPALRPGLRLVVVVEVSRNGVLAGREEVPLVAAADTIAAMVPVGACLESVLADDPA
ncbi:helix-turn-helix transcriptional regulator [Actinoplanes sp. NPDC049118]|uniref:helix-turn-helix domain-containing protein n=1 Tax=Actinoplanes sp. NPDC049118 TaxID=3155769 RepID=UPI0033F3D125